MPKTDKDGRWVLCRRCGSTALFTPAHVDVLCMYCAAIFDPGPNGTLLVMGPAQRPEEAPNAGS